MLASPADWLSGAVLPGLGRVLAPRTSPASSPPCRSAALRLGLARPRTAIPRDRLAKTRLIMAPPRKAGSLRGHETGHAVTGVACIFHLAITGSAFYLAARLSHLPQLTSATRLAICAELFHLIDQDQAQITRIQLGQRAVDGVECTLDFFGGCYIALVPQLT